MIGKSILAAMIAFQFHLLDSSKRICPLCGESFKTFQFHLLDSWTLTCIDIYKLREQAFNSICWIPFGAPCEPPRTFGGGLSIPFVGFPSGVFDVAYPLRLIDFQFHLLDSLEKLMILTRIWCICFQFHLLDSKDIKAAANTLQRHNCFQFHLLDSIP